MASILVLENRTHTHMVSPSSNTITLNTLTKDKKLPIDFVSMEEVYFYGGFGPVKPDRVYQNNENILVAFFSRDKCLSIQKPLKQSANKFYNDNRAALYPQGYYIGEYIECENEEGLSKGTQTKIFCKNIFKSAWSAFGLYFIATSVAVPEALIENMYNRAKACWMNNTIVKSGNKNPHWLSEDGKMKFFGIEVSIGNQNDSSHSCRFTSTNGNNDNLFDLNLMSLPSILNELRETELMLRYSNAENDEWMKNIACARLTKIDTAFVENYERQLQFLDTKRTDIHLHDIQEFATILTVRRYINNLVLAYRWMTVNVNFFDSGDLTCLRIASSSNRYYFSRNLVNTLTNNITRKLSIEINRYFNRCDIELATLEFLKQGLEKSNIRIDSLTNEERELELHLEELGNNLIDSSTDIFKNSTSILNALYDIPSVFENQDQILKIINTCQSIKKTEQELDEIRRQINTQNNFRELIYFHCQLIFIQKYFPDFTAIIINEKKQLFRSPKYDIQFLR